MSKADHTETGCFNAARDLLATDDSQSDERTDDNDTLQLHARQHRPTLPRQLPVKSKRPSLRTTDHTSSIHDSLQLHSWLDRPSLSGELQRQPERLSLPTINDSSRSLHNDSIRLPTGLE
jgi:hypothetical protein